MIEITKHNATEHIGTGYPSGLTWWDCPSIRLRTWRN